MQTTSLTSLQTTRETETKRRVRSLADTQTVPPLIRPPASFDWTLVANDEESNRGALQFSIWLTSELGAHEVRLAWESPDLGRPAWAHSADPDDTLRGLIVTRSADLRDDSVIRLGPDARELLTDASCPVFVVPRDLRADLIGRGPIIVAVDPESTPPSVARFAAEVARSKGRSLVLATVANPDPAVVLNDPQGLDRAYEDARRLAEDELRRWAYTNDLSAADRRVLRGDVRYSVQSFADELDACFVVCGTRQRSAIARLFAPSNALELARYARCPVLVVPPGEVERLAPVTDPHSTR